MAARPVGRDARGDIPLDRVAANLGEQGGRQARFVMAARAFAIIGRPANPGSVTSKGRSMASVRQAAGNAAMRPSPNQIVVG